MVTEICPVCSGEPESVGDTSTVTHKPRQMTSRSVKKTTLRSPVGVRANQRFLVHIPAGLSSNEYSAVSSHRWVWQIYSVEKHCLWSVITMSKVSSRSVFLPLVSWECTLQWVIYPLQGLLAPRLMLVVLLLPCSGLYPTHPAYCPSVNGRNLWACLLLPTTMSPHLWLCWQKSGSNGSDPTPIALVNHPPDNGGDLRREGGGGQGEQYPGLSRFILVARYTCPIHYPNTDLSTGCYTGL